MTTSVACRKCGAAIEPADGPGRPKTFCSVGCRRAAEREIRRLDRALESVEDRLRYVRINGSHEPAARRYEAERVRLEHRLRELLADGGDGS